jgi:uncharacterized membrane protein
MFMTTWLIRSMLFALGCRYWLVPQWHNLRFQETDAANKCILGGLHAHPDWTDTKARLLVVMLYVFI